MPAQFAPRGTALLEAFGRANEGLLQGVLTRRKLEQADRETQARERMQQRGIEAQQQSQREAQQNYLEVLKQRQAFEMQQIQARQKSALDQQFISKYGAGLEALQAEADQTLNPEVYRTPGERLRMYTQGLDAQRQKAEYEQQMKMGMEALDNQQQRDLDNLDRAMEEVRTRSEWNPVYDGDQRREQMLAQLEQRRVGIILGAAERASSGRGRGTASLAQQEPEWKEEQHPELGWVQRNRSTGEIKGINPGAGSALRQGSSAAGGAGGASRGPGGIPQFKSPEEKIGYFVGEATKTLDEQLRSAGGFEIPFETRDPITGKTQKGTQTITPFHPQFKDLYRQAVVNNATARMEAMEALVAMEAQRMQEMQAQQMQQQALDARMKRMQTFISGAPMDMAGIILPPEMGGPPVARKEEPAPVTLNEADLNDAERANVALLRAQARGTGKAAEQARETLEKWGLPLEERREPGIMQQIGQIMPEMMIPTGF